MRPHLVAWLDGIMPWHVATLIAPSWFTAVGLAGVVTLLVMVALARRHRIDPGAVASIVLWSYVAAVIAGIVMPIFVDVVQQRLTTGHVKLRWAGMTSFWGYLAGFGAVVIACREYRIGLGRLGDLAAAPLGLALMFSRIGCFLGGCDYGKVTNVPWAVRFPANSPAWHDQVNAGLLPASRAESLPVHPTQLYEAALGLVIAGIALVVARQPWARAKEGRIALVAIAVYAIGRIGVETLRADVGRGIYAGLSSGQIFSICVLAAIAFGWLSQRRRGMRALAAATLALGVIIGVGHTHDAHAQTAPQKQPQQQPAPQ
jgi:prolipoprotein diacylglyceryltransferase